MINLWRRRPEPEEEAPDLGPMPSIFEQPPPPPLALIPVRELLPPLWRITGEDGQALARSLRFLSDGRLLGAADERLARWELSEGKLLVAPAAGEASCTFDRRELRRRRDTMLGVSVLSNGEVALSADLDDLLSVGSLARPSGPLLVAFNSNEHPFDGHGYPDWEFEDCVTRTNSDFVMFAERDDPPFWFLNKTARVLTRLRQLPASGYQELVFVGQSSGGFAAILFAELLSYEFPACRIRSITVNPQTTHGSEHEQSIRAAAAPEMLPRFVEPDTLMQKDCGVADIRELVRMSKRKRGHLVEHRVLYDDGNAAEAYQAHPIDDLDGFHLQPVTLGLPHAQGIVSIRGSEHFRQALDWGLEP